MQTSEFRSPAPAAVKDNLMSTDLLPPGLAPVDENTCALPPIPGALTMLVALYSFQALEPNQLTFAIGDVVKVLDQNADGPEWWKVQRVGDNAVGIVPNNYFVSTMHFPMVVFAVSHLRLHRPRSYKHHYLMLYAMYLFDRIDF